MKITIPIPPSVIMDIKKQVVKEVVEKLNKDYTSETGNLRNSISWQQKDGKFYVLKGMEIIAII